VAAPALAAGTTAETENQPVPVAVTPVHKKKDAKKSDHPVRDNHEPGPSQETEIITQSLSQSELQDMWKDFSCHPGEVIATWLLRFWDNWANNLEGREAKQLGSLARQGGINKAVGKKAQALSPWK